MTAPQSRGRVLIAEADRELRRSLAKLLLAHGFEALTAEDGSAALAILATTSVDVLIGDLGISPLAPRAREIRPDLEIIVTAGLGDIEAAVAAARAGGYDFIAKPFVVEDAIPLAAARAVERRRLKKRARALEERLEEIDALGEIVGESKGIQEAYRIALGAAQVASPALVIGESGTGKDLFAEIIHRRGGRADQPMRVLRCGALPEGSLEEELFGIEGDDGGRPGLVELADKGTLFLDHVEALPLAAQARLTNLLSRGETTRVKSSKSRRVDVRVIASATPDLKERVAAGTFREDLLYKLRALSIHLPPLRKRKEDIPLLAYHFLHKHARRAGRDLRRIGVEALRSLRERAWPGNVRELEAAIEHSVAMARGPAVLPSDLPTEGREDHPGEGARGGSGELGDLPYAKAKERVIEAFDRAYVDDLLERVGGNLSEAARIAGMDRSNWKRLVRKVRGG
jgi:DNA-binding NtrC family response regulator